MNDSPLPVPPKKRRARKTRKSGSATDDVFAHSIVAQTGGEGTDIVALPLENKKKTRRPRKRKADLEAPVDMIVPTDPIVSNEATPIKLAVPVGSPFPVAPPKPVKRPRLPAALPPQIVAFRASMPVPVEYNHKSPAARTHWRLSNLFPGSAVSRIADVLRRHPRSTGLVMTAILLGISLTTVIILSDAPKSDVAAQKAEESPVLAAAPAGLPVQQAPVSIAEGSDPLANVRIVDPSWDKKLSCNEGTWPYIDQRCLVKDEATSNAKVENKIGPGMIGPRARPAAPEASGPIGSTTAIVPAAPKAPTTDGVAPRDLELEKEGQKEAEPVRDVAPSQLVETQTSTRPAQTVTPRSSRQSTRSAQRRQPVRTFRLSEETKPVVTQQQPVVTQQRRAASVKRKRQPYVADAGRRRVRERVVRQAQVPQAPQFFFPFGWFVQAR